MISHSWWLVKIHDIAYIGGMGRKRINDEQTPARFPAGMLERIDAALVEAEKRSDLIREAVERELKRRARIQHNPR
jgi:hypothetical protein